MAGTGSNRTRVGRGRCRAVREEPRPTKRTMARRGCMRGDTRPLTRPYCPSVRVRSRRIGDAFGSWCVCPFSLASLSILSSTRAGDWRDRAEDLRGIAAAPGRAGDSSTSLSTPGTLNARIFFSIGSDLAARAAGLSGWIGLTGKGEARRAEPKCEPPCFRRPVQQDFSRTGNCRWEGGVSAWGSAHSGSSRDSASRRSASRSA